MRYEDKRYGFSLEIPSNWLKQIKFPQFTSTGGRIAYESPDGKASINISAGELNEKRLNDRLTMRTEAIKFLKNNPHFPIVKLEGVENFVLDGEKNTVYFKYIGHIDRGRDFGRILSSVHDEIEYVIQSGDIGNSYETTIDNVINSFKFRKIRI